MARAKRADSDSDDLKPAPARGRKKAPAAAGATDAKGKKVERKKRPRQSDDEGEAASGKAGNGDKSLGARLAVKKMRATEAPPSATEVVEKSSVGPTTLEDKYRALKNVCSVLDGGVVLVWLVLTHRGCAGSRDGRGATASTGARACAGGAKDARGAGGETETRARGGDR